MKNNVLLFGGALMAAGLAAQSAEADLVFSYTFSLVVATDYAVLNYEIFQEGAGPWSIFAEAPGAAAASEATADAIRLSAPSVDGSASYAWLPVAYFTVTSTVTADLSWDLHFNQNNTNHLRIWNLTDAVLLLEELGGSGAAQVLLEEGKEYIFDGFVFTAGIDEGTAFLEMVIPACSWDLDGDAVVGGRDLLLVLGSWGKNPGHPADFDGDGIVGAADLIELLGNWGPCKR